MASTMSAQPQNSVFPKAHVGFDSITSQIEKKLLKRGFQFNVICVGAFSHKPSAQSWGHTVKVYLMSPILIVA